MKNDILSIIFLLSATLCAHAQNESSSPQKLPLVIQNLIEDMVYVEGGTFTMGDNSIKYNNAFKTTDPEHQVTLSPFFICRYEVTQEVWDAVMGNNRSRVQNAKLPVSNVCWDESMTFILKLVVMTGINFRLPTEAEWEFAARGGNKSRQTIYSGSNNIDSVAWYQYNSSEKPHPVGQKSPNELGLYDMNGNVWEWCFDYYAAYDSAAQTDPKGALNSSTMVARGGDCFMIPEDCRVSSRYGRNPVFCSPSSGFRLAATP